MFETLCTMETMILLIPRERILKPQFSIAINIWKKKVSYLLSNNFSVVALKVDFKIKNNCIHTFTGSAIYLKYKMYT